MTGATAPFYGLPGGGVQYYSPTLSVSQLIEFGYIRPIVYKPVY
ncbi:MAG: TNT domain-containing protein [Alistipes sp.]|nr:TNT domain-containing protein [Alistipes sp.]